MIFRRESARERTLLNLIERQQRMIDNLLDRLAYAQGHAWGLPPHPENINGKQEPEERTWTATPEQEQV